MQYKSKVDIIYELLMKGITSGVYKCGDRLVIRQIAQQNSISEIPVREAIRRLESEGYVTIHPNQGAMVSMMTASDVLEIFQLKGLLEGYATRMAIDYLTEKDYEELRQINEELRRATKEHEFGLCGELNMKFHLRIYDCLPQRRLTDMIVELWKKWQITKSVFKHSPDRSMHSVCDHESILHLMKEKRCDEVEMLVRDHKFRAGYELAEYIEKANK